MSRSGKSTRTRNINVEAMARITGDSGNFKPKRKERNFESIYFDKSSMNSGQNLLSSPNLSSIQFEKTFKRDKQWELNQQIEETHQPKFKLNLTDLNKKLTEDLSPIEKTKPKRSKKVHGENKQKVDKDKKSTRRKKNSRSKSKKKRSKSKSRKKQKNRVRKPKPPKLPLKIYKSERSNSVSKLDSKNQKFNLTPLNRRLSSTSFKFVKRSKSNPYKKAPSIIFTQKIKKFPRFKKKIQVHPAEKYNQQESTRIDYVTDEYLFLLLDSLQLFNFNIRDLRPEFMNIKNILKDQLAETIKQRGILVIENRVIVDYLMPFVKFPVFTILGTLLAAAMVQIASPGAPLMCNVIVLIHLFKLATKKFMRLNLVKTTL